jgi:WD40 repeat protein
MDLGEKSLYVGGMDGKIYHIHLFDSICISDITLNSQENIKNTFKGHNKSINCLAISFDGSLLVSGSDDGSCYIWDTSSKQLIKTYNGHKGPITNIFITLKPIDIFDLTISNNQNILLKPIQSFKKFQYHNENDKILPILSNYELKNNIFKKKKKKFFIRKK